MQIEVVKGQRVGERTAERLVERASMGVGPYWKRNGTERLRKRRTFGTESGSLSVAVTFRRRTESDLNSRKPLDHKHGITAQRADPERSRLA
jgi:hypothetical protein